MSDSTDALKHIRYLAAALKGAADHRGGRPARRAGPRRELDP
jgi:hypothetical protein